MYQIFEIMLNPKENDLEKKLEVNKVNWHINGRILTKDDDGLQYILDLTSFKLKCVIPELFPIDEGDCSNDNTTWQRRQVFPVFSSINSFPTKRWKITLKSWSARDPTFAG